jgi:alpha-beta hydrolase superfamily lysophospholipase
VSRSGAIDAETHDPAPDAFFFGPAERPLFGVFHGLGQPAPAREDEPSARPTVVVLCNPFGVEAMCLHRTYRHIAERLSRAGVSSLRFDYDGTGNSAGRDDEPQRFGAWVNSVHAALAEARSRVDGCRIVLFGARLGATLGAVAALDDGNIDGLVLWAPVVSGRSYARELRAMRGLRAGKATPRADGAHDAAGYAVTAATLVEISSVDLTALGNARSLPPLAFLVPGEAPSATQRLARDWQARGCSVRVGARTSYTRLLGDPYDAVVPQPFLNAFAEWVGKGKRSGGGKNTRVRVDPHRSTATFNERGATIRETSVAFGDGLFAVFTEPDVVGAHPNRPATILLNAGVNHHVGPHRMWVTLAREIAALGYATLRMDAAGIGESCAEAGALENRVYSPGFVANVRAGMDLLERLRGTREYVLVGLCSGAYVAFHTAVADSRVVGQLLLNTHTFTWKEGDSVRRRHNRRFYVRCLLDPGVWRRGLRAPMKARRVTRMLLRLLEPELTTVRRNLGEKKLTKPAGRGVEAPVDVNEAFEVLSRRGVESLLVFSSFDGGLDMLAGHLGRRARKIRGLPHFTLDVLGEVEHDFRPLEQQALMRRLLTRYLTSHFP